MIHFHLPVFLLRSPTPGCPQGARCHYDPGSILNGPLPFILLVVVSLAIPIISVMLVNRQKRRKLEERPAPSKDGLIRLEDALRAAETALSEASMGSLDYQRAEQQKKQIEKEIADLRQRLETTDQAM